MEVLGIRTGIGAHTCALCWRVGDGGILGGHDIAECVCRNTRMGVAVVGHVRSIGHRNGHITFSDGDGSIGGRLIVVAVYCLHIYRLRISGSRPSGDRSTPTIIISAIINGSTIRNAWDNRYGMGDSIVRLIVCGCRQGHSCLRDFQCARCIAQGIVGGDHGLATLNGGGEGDGSGAHVGLSGTSEGGNDGMTFH